MTKKKRMTQNCSLWSSVFSLPGFGEWVFGRIPEARTVINNAEVCDIAEKIALRFLSYRWITQDCSSSPSPFFLAAEPAGFGEWGFGGTPPEPLTSPAAAILLTSSAGAAAAILMTSAEIMAANASSSSSSWTYSSTSMSPPGWNCDAISSKVRFFVSGTFR